MTSQPWRRIAALALFAANCRSPATTRVDPRIDEGTINACPDERCLVGRTVEIRFLGVAGFFIRFGQHSLLTGPMFSNPSVNRVLENDWIRSDRRMIDRFLPAAADSASMIVVGHGHYDHLMDVPDIAKRRARTARIYGGPSIANMLSRDKTLASRITSITGDSVGEYNKRGEWVYNADSSVRIMAFRGNHAPLARILSVDIPFVPGTVGDDHGGMPNQPYDWKRGEPYVYLIDILDARKQPVFRFYYQDTASDAPLGYPAFEILHERRIDLAILAVANAHLAHPASPGLLLHLLHPRYIIAAHWEDFFLKRTDGVRPGAASKIELFQKALADGVPKDGRWWMPKPQTVFQFPTRP